MMSSRNSRPKKELHQDLITVLTKLLFLCLTLFIRNVSNREPVLETKRNALCNGPHASVCTYNLPCNSGRSENWIWRLCLLQCDDCGYRTINASFWHPIFFPHTNHKDCFVGHYFCSGFRTRHRRAAGKQVIKSKPTLQRLTKNRRQRSAWHERTT